jgi:autotransporter translocation and assembly factor TamB
VDTAIVYFINPNKLNPIVNLKATSQVTVYERQQSTDYTIILTITGYLDQPVVTLTSNPPLNKSDILSVLTLGTTTGNILNSTQSGSGVTNILTSRVESFSSQRITSYLSTQFGNLLGLDEVTIEGNIFRFNQGGGPQLVAKKTFLKNFEVTYSTIVGHINDQGVRLNYQFTRHWSIQGESNQQGETGLDLKYQINFK